MQPARPSSVRRPRVSPLMSWVVLATATHSHRVDCRGGETKKDGYRRCGSITRRFGATRLPIVDDDAVMEGRKWPWMGWEGGKTR